MEKSKNEKKPATNNHYGAMEKCQAVLSVWTERRKPVEVCRELSIPWMMLSHWQQRAMEGMLQALEPRVNLEKGPALSPRLQTLLEKRRMNLMTSAAQRRLEKTLLKAQESNKTIPAIAKELKPTSGETLRKVEKG